MSEIKYLLPDVPRYYKANLHTHSNVSDGKYSPEEVKRLYKEKGYNILAFTDHSIMAYHPDEPGENFVTLAGGEFNINLFDEHAYYGAASKTYHINFIAPDPNKLWQPYSSGSKKETAQPFIAKTEIGKMPRVYDLKAVNDIIAEANRRGYLVTYNHPVWSLQDWPDYIGLRGLWAMEVTNTASKNGGKDEDNSMIYHSLVKSGMHLFPVAADDMHTGYELAQSWCMVGAKELKYDSVFEALKNGDFYASVGPEIKSITVEDGTLRVECSEAVEIRVQTHIRLSRRALAEEGKTFTGAEFDMPQFFENERKVPGAFLRVTVIDSRGRYAMSRAYYLYEIR